MFYFIAWRQEPRQEPIQLIMGSKHAQENQDLTEIVSDNEPDEIIDLMAIKSILEGYIKIRGPRSLTSELHNLLRL